MLPPVAEPAIARGQDARVALGHTRDALRQANGRLVRSRVIYDGVRRQYGGQ